MAIQDVDLYRPRDYYPLAPPVAPYIPSSFNLEDQSYAAIQDERARRDAADQEFRDLAPYDYNQYRRYGELSDRAWEDALAGRGGYTPEEIARMREASGGWRDFSPTGVNYNDFYLTGDEQGGIAGDPFAARDWLNPEQLRGYLQDAADRQYDAYGTVSRETSGAVNPNLYIPEGDISRIYGALSPSLALSEGFKDEYVMSPDEVAQYGELAGRIANATYDADMDEIRKRAEASGGTSAMALASLGEHMRRRGSQSKADATMQARLDANAQRRSQIANAEQMRLDAERAYSGLGIEAGSTAAGLRQRGGSMYGDALMQRGFGLGEMEAGIGRDVADRGLATERYITDTGASYTQYGDDARSRRAAELGFNRQNTARDVSADRYNRDRDAYDRGFEASNQRVGLERDIAGERVADTRGGRDYTTGSRDFYSDRFSKGQDVRDRNRAISGELEAGARDRQFGAKRSGLGKQIIGAALGRAFDVGASYGMKTG